jgi:hypothetical protein
MTVDEDIVAGPQKMSLKCPVCAALPYLSLVADLVPSAELHACEHPLPLS